jgi:low molecular weight protein-tyrosine phosphatase
MEMSTIRLLFVCMGNICRSPMAEGVMRKLTMNAGLHHVEVDSAGTHGYHVGKPPDPRALYTAGRRAYDIAGLRARRITAADFERFDLVLAMDFNNLGMLQNMCPAEHRLKLAMLMSYAGRFNAIIVQDPYYRGAADFERTLDYIEDACEGLLQVLIQYGKEVGHAPVSDSSYTFESNAATNPLS